MTQTKMKSLHEQVEEARQEHLSALRKIADLEAEAGAFGASVSKIDFSGGAAPSKLAELTQRRQALPFMIKRAKCEEAEAELKLHDLQMAEAEESRPVLERQMEEKRLEFEAARRALNHAKAEHSELVYGIMSDIRRAHIAAKERLAALDREDPSGESRGPVVRSTWQANMGSPGEENFVQDTPAALHFGSANIRDVPVSMQDETPATVVIPEEATKRGGG